MTRSTLLYFSGLAVLVGGIKAPVGPVGTIALFVLGESLVALGLWQGATLTGSSRAVDDVIVEQLRARYGSQS